MKNGDGIATQRLDPAAFKGPGQSVGLTEGSLLVLDGPDRGRRFAVRPPGLRIGTARDSDVVLTDPTVSKAHARIDETPEGFVLRDLNSTNGTFLDTSRIREVYLNPGATLRLGSTVMTFEPPGARVLVPPSAAGAFGEMRGKSSRLRQVFGIFERIAPTPSTVLITGESGTGKEVAARSIHMKSALCRGPFVVFDCSSVARELVESTLFGHVEGAFTGAASRRRGALVSAEGGTLFIDEIGELPLDLQPKLLRVLERREVQPLGTDAPVRVEVRVIAATHRDLKKMVKDGQFRQDLYYRLSVIEVTLPRLRDRPEDIPDLVSHFLPSLGRAGTTVSDAAFRVLMGHTWEGNVRELRNVLERALIFAGDGPIEPEHLALGAPGPGEGPAVPVPDLLDGAKSLDDVQAEVIRATLERTGWNKTQAAKTLGITRKTLLDKIARYGLTGPGGSE